MNKRHYMTKIMAGIAVSAWLFAVTSGCEMLGLGGGGDTTTSTTAAAPVKAKGTATSAKPTKKSSATDEKKRWEYDPTEKLDPFVAPPPPQLPTNEGGSDPYELEQMLLVGIIQGSGMDRALVLMPDGNTKAFKLEDKLGKMGGIIKEIGKDYIIVEETYIKPGPEAETTTFVIRKKMELQEPTVKGKRR